MRADWILSLTIYKYIHVEVVAGLLELDPRAGNPSVHCPGAVSYTHLTLPTNREV